MDGYVVGHPLMRPMMIDATAIIAVAISPAVLFASPLRQRRDVLD